MKVKAEIDVDPRKFENILTFLIIILMVLEVIAFTNEFFVIRVPIIQTIVSKLYTIKELLTRLALLLFGLFALAKFSNN